MLGNILGNISASVVKQWYECNFLKNLSELCIVDKSSEICVVVVMCWQPPKGQIIC